MGELEGEDDGGEWRSVTPASAPAMPMSAHTPGDAPGKTWPITPPMAAPIMRIGARMPPLVPPPSPPDQMTSLTTKSNARAPDAELAEQFGVDGVVADTERPRINEAAEPDDYPADHRPPHPVQVTAQLLEEVLEAVHRLGHDPGAEPVATPTAAAPRRTKPPRGPWLGPGRAVEARRDGRSPWPCEAVSSSCCHSDEDHRAWLELEGQ